MDGLPHSMIITRLGRRWDDLLPRLKAFSSFFLDCPGRTSCAILAAHPHLETGRKQASPRQAQKLLGTVTCVDEAKQPGICHL